MRLSSYKDQTNIFEVISRATSRTEPFHSRYIAALFQNSALLIAKFLQHIEDPLRCSTDGAYEVDEEFQLNKSGCYIDIIVGWPNLNRDQAQKVIGIEVKTADKSSTKGQLKKYWKQMKEHFGLNESQMHLIYLVPFDEKSLKNAGLDKTHKTHAMEEYNSFVREFPLKCDAINWLDFASIQESCLEDFEEKHTLIQHIRYGRNIIGNPEELTRVMDNKDLVGFFGSDAVRRFYDFLKNNALEPDQTEEVLSFNLSELKDYSLLIEALLILIKAQENPEEPQAENSDSNKRPKPINKIADGIPQSLIKGCSEEKAQLIELIERYMSEGTHQSFFESLFEEIAELKYVWLKGKSNLGLRVRHPDHPSSGVSVCTLKPDKVEIYKKRISKK